MLFQEPGLAGGKPPDLAELGPHYLLTETYFLSGGIGLLLVLTLPPIGWTAASGSCLR